jgi:hypothetical protein
MKKTVIRIAGVQFKIWSQNLLNVKRLTFVWIYHNRTEVRFVTLVFSVPKIIQWKAINGNMFHITSLLLLHSKTVATNLGQIIHFIIIHPSTVCMQKWAAEAVLTPFYWFHVATTQCSSQAQFTNIALSPFAVCCHATSTAYNTLQWQMHCIRRCRRVTPACPPAWRFDMVQ